VNEELVEQADDGYLVQLTQAQLYKDINSLCRENGLPEIGIHGLRHTFATIGWENGIPQKTIMALGGWSNPQTVNEIYTHLSAEKFDEGKQKFAEVLRGL